MKSSGPKRKKSKARKPAMRPPAPRRSQPAPSARTDDTFLQEIFSAVEHISDSIVIFGWDDTVQYVNSAFEKLSGYTRQEAVGKSIIELLESGHHPASFHDEQRAMLHAGKEVRATYVNKNKAGKLFYEEKTIAPLRDPEGNILSFVSTGRDITRQIKTEEDLRASIHEAESEARKFQSLLESAPDAIVGVNREGKMVLVNLQTEVLFGYQREELLGQPVEILLPGALQKKHVQHRESYSVNPHTRSMGEKLDLVARRKDGSEFPVEISLSPLQTEEGLLITSIIRDVTERKRVQEALRQKDEAFRSLVERAPYGIYRSNVAGNFHLLNRALVDMLGYDSEKELLALNMATQVYADPRQRAQLIEQHRETGRFTNVDVEWKRKDGKLITVRLSGHSFPGENPEDTVFEVVAEDITQQRSLEQQVRHSQKMEAIGRLTGGIAHNFNNLLTLVYGYTELLQEKLGRGHPALSTVAEIQKAAERATTLTKQLLAFSRKQPLQPEIFSLHTAVEQMEKMLRRVIGEDITLEISLDPAPAKIRAEPGHVEQILMNFAVNARDAMPHGGRLTIRTENIVLAENDSLRVPTLSPGSYVTLEVSDTGVGMDAETQARIFEPFFTTKEKDKGTGLGLATVYGIVTQSGGHVTVSSQPGEGTTFQVFLPRIVSAPGESPTVLLVEDEDPLRRVAQEFLTLNGYTVLPAATGAEALRLAGQHREPIHLLVTDMVMPGMSGRELASQLIRLQPDVKILYISGYTYEEVLPSDKTAPEGAFLQKPFALDALTQKMRDLLAV